MEVKGAIRRFLRRGMIVVDGERYFFNDFGNKSFVVLLTKNENGDLNVYDAKGQILGVAGLMKKEIIQKRKVAMVVAFHKAMSAHGIPTTLMADNGPAF